MLVPLWWVDKANPDLQVTCAIAFALFFGFLMVLEMGSMDVGGYEGEEHAHIAFFMFCCAVLTLIFGLYFLVPVGILFALACLIALGHGFVQMFRHVFGIPKGR